MHTQVGIIGAGPAGLFLAHLLYREGIDCVVLEARSRAYVEDRVRAGVLEQGTVDLMRELGLDERLRRECMIDEAIDIRFSGKLIHVHFPELVAGKKQPAIAHRRRNVGAHRRHALLENPPLDDLAFITVVHAYVQFVPEAVVGPARRVLIRRHLHIVARNLRRAPAAQRKAVLVMGLGQLLDRGGF